MSLAKGHAAPPILLAAERVGAAQLSSLIGEMVTHVHRRSARDTLAVLNQKHLTMGQLAALHILLYEGTCSVGTLANCLHLSPAAASHLVDRLVTATLVQRMEDPSDRRSKQVTITAPGRKLVEKVQDARTREFTQVLSRLSPGVRRRFGQVLVRVIEELSSLPQDKR